MIGYTICVNSIIYSQDIMSDGISNYGKTNVKDYYPSFTSGNRTYIFGHQNGNFPNISGHLADEMGGIWMHPIKLADGFWMKIKNTETNESVCLDNASSNVTYPYGSNYYYYNLMKSLDIERVQFCPDHESGIIVCYNIKNKSSRSISLNIDFSVRSDLLPSWFAKENGLYDYPDELKWDGQKSCFVVKDSIHSWFLVWGGKDINNVHHLMVDEIPVEKKGNGVTGKIGKVYKIGAGKTLKLVYALAGSLISEGEALTQYNRLLTKYKQMFLDKKELYQTVVNRSCIDIPDKKLQLVYDWAKVNTKWLEMNVPGMGTFVAAGAPSFTWLFGCDNSYALQGVAATGDFELAKKTLRTLKKESIRLNGDCGRIVHEVSTNGFCYNLGNTQETAHFIVAVWNVFSWCGDLEFLREFYPFVQKSLKWLLEEKDKNRNMFPEGFGIMEVTNLNKELIDAAVYTQQALLVVSKMADIFNDQNKKEEYFNLSEDLKERINKMFWCESENSYYDFYSTKEEALEVLQSAISESWEVNKPYYKSMRDKIKLSEKEQSGWFSNKNWVRNTPMETGIAPYEIAIKALDNTYNNDLGPNGPWLSAVDRRRMMPIATGVQAVAECKYGRTDKAMEYVNMIADTFSEIMPGATTEYSPNYGNQPQAWNLYGIAVPLITHVFGVLPDAYNKYVMFSPNMPKNWNNIKLCNQKIGNANFDFSVQYKGAEQIYIIKVDKNGWKYVLDLPDSKGKLCTINGEEVYSSGRYVLSGKYNKIVIR